MRSEAGSAVNAYISSIFAGEDALLQRIREKGEALQAGMQVSAVEGKMLFCFARMAGAARILEIGTFVGYSTLWMARALPESGTLITLEADAKHADLAQGYFSESEVAGKITIRRGKALESLAAMAGEALPPFDMVFIDAAKGEYAEYLTLVTPMIRKGGLIVGDNTLLFGAMAGEKPAHVSEKAVRSMQEFNRKLSDSTLFDSILLPTEEGMTVARKIA